MHHVGTETRIESLSGSCSHVVDTGDSWLRECCRGRRNWRIVTVDSDAESIGNRGVRWTAKRRRAPDGHEVLPALNCLDKPRSQERYEDQVNAVQAAINAAVPAADYALVAAKHLA